MNIQPSVMCAGNIGYIPETVGALCAVDYKGVSNQLVSAGKVICE